MLTASDVIYDEIEHVNDCDLGRARNSIFAAFLRSDAERLLMIDADLSFDFRDAMKLIRSTKDYVGGNYPRKSIGGGWASTPQDSAKEDGDLIEARILANGLVALSRSAVERMSEVSPTYLTDDGWTASAIARPGVYQGRWVLDDESTCLLWQSLGEIAWLDRTIICGHVGSLEFTADTAEERQ